MPSIVVKATPERDLYAIWSTIVDSVTFIGTRREMKRHLTVHRDVHANDAPEVRLARADVNGTSALYPYLPPYYGAWEDTGFIYKQRGWLPRSRLVELLDRLAADEDADVTDLLDPFDDDPPQ